MKKSDDNKQELLEQQYENQLQIRGVYRLINLNDAIDTWGSRIIYLPFIFLIVRFLHSIYYYPRTIKYLVSHPISEILYLIEDGIGDYIGGAIGIALLVAVICFIIKKIIIKRAETINRQICNDLGITNFSTEKE